MSSLTTWRAPFAAALVATCLATTAFAGANPHFTLPLQVRATCPSIA